jgi:hypothetical protein
MAAIRRSTREEVNLILATLTDIKRDGTIYSYEVFAAILAPLGIHMDDPHFYSVLKALKRHVKRAYGVLLEAVPGIGYRACTESEHLMAGIKQIRQGVDMVIQGNRSALAPHEQTLRDHTIGATSTLLAMAVTWRTPSYCPEPQEQRMRQVVLKEA